MVVKKQMPVMMQALDKQILKVKIAGVTPLLMEKMDSNVVKNIDKKKSQQTVEKDLRPESEKVEGKIHRDDKGNIAFPSSGFHKGMVEVAPYLDGLDKKRVKGSIRMVDSFVPLKYKKRTINETEGVNDGVSKSPRLIIRPQFDDWSCDLKIMYNRGNISAEQIINLLNWAGFQMGLGGWRPECNGIFGQYAVVGGKGRG